MGHTTQALGEGIIAARVTYNEALATQGPKHPSTIEALVKLKHLTHSARILFAK